RRRRPRRDRVSSRAPPAQGQKGYAAQRSPRTSFRTSRPAPPQKEEHRGPDTGAEPRQDPGVRPGPSLRRRSPSARRDQHHQPESPTTPRTHERPSTARAAPSGGYGRAPTET